MHVFETVAELRAARAVAPPPVGLVPTMGYLHEGHLSLINRARAECPSVFVSIFVNPTQFGPHEDFERYPRDVARDLRLCEQAAVDVVFAPPTSEMYPPGDATSVEVGRLSQRWEGATRPGHFRGVATVVTKLFRIALPDRAYFGEKDYQQLQIVKRLAADLRLDVEIVPCPTVREADGRAMSSRNAYLDEAARARAVALSGALREAQRLVEAGERNGLVLRSAMEKVIADAGLELDYAAVVDPETLEPVEQVEREARALIAARLSRVRLIDNMALLSSRQ